MLNPPRAAQAIFQKLAPAFTAQTAVRMQTLVLGAILVSGRRTFTHILAFLAGLVQGHYSTYYRVFSRAPWLSLQVGRILATLVIELVPRDEPIFVLADTTVSEHRGAKVYGKGRHRDAVRSTHSYTAWRWGHQWVALCVAVQLVSVVSRRWALPVLVALYRNESVNQAEGRRHKTQGDLSRQLMRLLLAWFPERKFIFVADGDFSSHEMARFARRHRRRLTFVGKFYADAALYAPPPPYSGKGRPRVKGAKQPAPQEVVAGASPWPTNVNWYGGGRRNVGLVNGKGHWHKSGFGLVPIRWVYVEDYSGTHRPEYFFSTDPQMSIRQIVESYTLRWSIEVTFEEIRAHLGFNTTRHRCAKAVQRVEPWLMGLFTLVTLIWQQHLHRHAPQTAAHPWYTKQEPTFADALRTVRVLIWEESILASPLLPEGLQKLTAKPREILLHWLTQAA